MSLNKIYKITPKISLLEISDILPKKNKEYCLIVNNNTDAETIYDNFETEIKQVTFSLDEEYLKKVIDIEDTSETDSSIYDNDDLISEIDLEDNNIIIEQKTAKNLIQCVIVNKINGYIRRCENSKSF
ncbi:hypothetical protein RclHR1_05260005 [Rhizophagus clarus]|uniref:Uncharacterized protein n=1 Tax=Rhizophagus clarus TaxID=94130 RepID=A0A2Z6RS55_9GLOM|nr:hypothetical protein RclHR1_05260005 [Rhizophagus clarus]GET02358.1 hypothetical protein GLOIN_2v1762625 [Rhizophagus clarus]